MADTDARPVGQDELVADIDRTRAQLARTIDAISDRVSPKRNVNRAMEEVRQRVDEIGQRVNAEPYTAGWIFRVRVAQDGDGDAALPPDLLSAAEYEELTKSAG